MLPPIAKQKPYTYQLHGNTHNDPYAWLRYQESDPDVLDYLKAENAYTKEFMKSTEPLQAALFKEMCDRIQLTDSTVPYFEKGFYYYWRTLEKEEYPLFCRREKALDREETILLNENILAKEHAYFHMGECETSPNQRYLAYTEDTSGGEEYRLYVKDLNTNSIITTPVDRIAPDIVWANDNATLFFTKHDEAWRPYQIWSYHLFTHELQLRYTETNPLFRVSVSRSKDDRFIFLEVNSMITSETHIVSADTPEKEFQCVYPRQENVKYDLFSHLDSWYLLTNQEAKNYQLIKAPMHDPNPMHWEVVIPHRPEVKLENIDIFRYFIVISERHDANVRLRVLDLKKNREYPINFPEPVYSVEPQDNIDFDSHTLRLAYTSLTTPRTFYDIDLDTQEKHFLKQTPVLGGFKPENYLSERLYATASDGTLIPISLVYHRDTKKTADTPLYLYGYGAYGVSLNPWFSHSRISLLDRGFIFAIAHIRGGGDNGEFWYEAGKLLLKNNTFTDFITSAEHLIKHHYTSSKQLVISGGSAGGLLIGAVLNLRPDLFAVAVADVPFVDALNTMLDPSIPLTIGEYVEWGNPENKEYYEYIKSYSPYDNVTSTHYPTTLVTAGLNDPRVQYWEPAKWVAKLRATKTDSRPLLLKVNMSAGHGGASGRFSALKEVVFEYAFILKVLGLA